MKKSKKRKQKIKEEDYTHYCAKCKKRTRHKGEGIKWIKYQERCIECGTVNYVEYQRQ